MTPDQKKASKASSQTREATEPILSPLSPTVETAVGWLVNAGIDDMTRRLHGMTGTPNDIATLEAAIAAEAAKDKPRPSRLKPLQSKLKRFRPAIDGKVEIVANNAQMDLDTIQRDLEAERDRIVQHEDAFKDVTLPMFLQMGLQCLKAQHLFALGPEDRQGVGGRGKKTLLPGNRVSEDGSEDPEEEQEPASFSDWLSKRVNWLNRASAYKYLRASKGLGLTHESTPKDLDKALAKARKALPQGKKLTLTMLANKAEEEQQEEEEQQDKDKNIPEAKAAEAREQVAGWISSWDKAVKAGNLEDADLETLQQLDEFLTATRESIRRRIKSSKS